MERKVHYNEVVIFATIIPIAAISAALLATTSSILFPIAVVSGFIFALLILQRRTQVAALCAGGAVCIIGASAQFLSSGVSGVAGGTPTSSAAANGPAIVARVLGVFMLVAAAISTNRTTVVHVGKRRQSRQWQMRLTLPVVGFVAASTLPHGLFHEFVVYELAAMLLVVSIIATSVRIPPHTLTQGLITALTLVVVGSLASGVISPGTALEQGRLRGLLENANTLGYFSFLLGAMAILTLRSLRLKVALLVPVVASLSWSASRASAVALLILAVGYLITKRPAQGTFTIAVLASGVIGLAVYVPSFRPWFALTLRTNNSRETSWQAALDALEQSRWWGVGLHSSDFAASSPLGAVAQGGLIGLTLVVLIWIGVLSFSMRRGRASLIFAFAACFHSLFEAWLLSPFSPLLLLFSACWWAISYQEREVSERFIEGRIDEKFTNPHSTLKRRVHEVP